MALKMLYRTEVKPPPHSLEISWVGNVIMVKWSLKYVAYKSVLCIISVNTRNTSHLSKKIKFKILSFMWASFGEISLLERNAPVGFINLLVT